MEDQVLKQFIEQHGEPVWKSTWAFFQDGTEGEHTEYGFRGVPGRDPQRKREAKILYWRYRLQDLVNQFNTQKEECAERATWARMTDADLNTLTDLQSQVHEATKQLDLLQNPPGPDPKEVQRAVRMCRQLRQLKWDCIEAETAYKENPLQKNGRRWQRRWDLWNEAHQKFLKIDEAIRKAAIGTVADEDYRNKIELQTLQLAEIEI